MMFTERGFRSFEIALLISAILHTGVILLVSRLKPTASADWDLNEISFMDVTYRPEVAKVISPSSASPGGKMENFESERSINYPSTPAGPVDEVAPIDLSATLERSPSQARINLDRYEVGGSEDMDVIKIGGVGSSRSTEEILAQAPIVLSRGGAGSGMGLRGMPGVPQQLEQPQLTIEHRPVSKPTKVDQLPPPVKSEATELTPVARGTSFQIAGPISQREIVKKVKPKYPKWALEQHISGKVTVRIWVLPNGTVKGVPQVLISSGYPDLDQVVLEAVRNWEFAPLGADVKPEEQWGDITFIFQLS